jgi:type IVB pilus formation R64 PilN family outer membrane protein
VSSSIALAGAGGSEGGSGGGGGSGSSGGGSSGNVSISGTSKINAFESVLMGVRGYALEDQALNSDTQNSGAGNQGNKSLTQVPGVIGNEGLGMVTVTATPPTLDRIASYIDNVNKRFARNIYINVNIYTVTVDSEAVNGVSISAAIANLAGTRGIDLIPSGLAQPSSGAPGQFTMRLANAGSSVNVVAQALNTIGNVSSVQSAQVIAANGQPAPFQIAEDVSFLESSTTTVVPNVGVTSALIQGTRTVGLTGNLIPRFLDDNRLLLQYQLNLSSMTLSEARSGNTFVQIPKISRQALQQQAYLDDGESLVLFGFEQKRTVSDNSSGILTISNRGNSQRTMVVIVMDVFGDAKAKTLKEVPNV